MQDDRFEWDDEKARSNYRKHGVDFETACAVFDDPLATDEFDDENSDDEDRFLMVGMAGGKLVAVSYTPREERIRIISARQATKDEHDDYYRQAQT